MHDLRKKILLESGKTVSRKARAKPESTRSSTTHSPIASPGGSRAGSRANSRPGSRYASEDEAGSDSDYDEAMTMSTNSGSGEDPADDDGSKAAWTGRLRERIEELQNRKGSSVHGREAALTAYLHLIRHHYALDEIEPSFGGIVTGLLDSVRDGRSADEKSLALQALAATIVTAPSDTVLDQVHGPLMKACQDDEEKLKTDAIHALSIATVYGGGSDAATSELLDFLREIVQSDGESVAAEDSGAVVVAALQAWAFVVASDLEDMSTPGEEAMEAFIDQLNSDDPDVQISAGCNIALVFEAARDYEEEAGESFIPQHQQHLVLTRMKEIVQHLPKSVSKEARRHLRQNFSSIITSLERGKGPGYSTARVHPDSGGVDSEGNSHEFGYREKLRMNNMTMVIDTWSLKARVEMLKTILGGGFAIQLEANEAVKDILENPVVEYVSAGAVARRKKAFEAEETAAKKNRRSLRSTEVF